VIVDEGLGAALRLVADEVVQKFGMRAAVVIAWDERNDAVITGVNAPSEVVAKNLCALVANSIGAESSVAIDAKDEKPRGSA